MEDTKLYKALYAFDGAKGDSIEDKIKDLNDKFKEIAEIILCKGYFLFGDKKVYVRDVEFYYHEENGNLKDPIMYHVNEKAPKNKKDEDKARYEKKKYFKIGAFNFHISGVDLTFEQEGKFRASALIRGFCEDEPNGEYDGRSTYFYDYFDFVSPFNSERSVKWVEDGSSCRKDEIEHTYRKNVPLYRRKKGENEIVLFPDFMKDGRNAYEPIPYEDKYKNKSINIEDFEINLIQTETSKKVQDTIRQWRFYRK